MSETMREPNLNYVQAFEDQGIADEYRTTEHFFFETTPDGAVYAVPLSILVPKYSYRHLRRSK